MDKVKRNCVVCKKGFVANRYHGLDRKSISEALACPKCRKKYEKGKEKAKDE